MKRRGNKMGESKDVETKERIDEMRRAEEYAEIIQLSEKISDQYPDLKRADFCE